MLFNSYDFLFAYFPLTLALLYATCLFRTGVAVWFLFGASICFYAWWSVPHVPLLLGSICFNYLCGHAIARASASDRWEAKAMLVFAVGANLALLGYFKYADFFLDTLSALHGVARHKLGVILPLGISFYTFTQIAFLVDAADRKVVNLRFSRYGLFVTYFPHLIAGPILHHRPMMEQFQGPEAFRANTLRISVGFSYFVVGLAKKVLIADRIAPYADAIFGGAKGGASLTFFEAWGGALAYSGQIYFDFSGYSDMAIGLGLMMGITLPINFNSPYQATSIIDFWRRWHITLSQFLRDYLYFRLGGNRYGILRRYMNLMLTMLLGGLWHGASWTFVAWGALHGAYLVVDHGYRALNERLGFDPFRLSSPAGRFFSWAVTMLSVVFAWVLFRAESFSTARGMLASMVGARGVNVPAQLSERLANLKGVLIFGGTFGNGLIHDWATAWLVISSGLVLAAVLPNSQYLFRRIAERPETAYSPGRLAALRGLAWHPSGLWLLVISALFVWCVFRLTGTTTFLYYQF